MASVSDEKPAPIASFVVFNKTDLHEWPSALCAGVRGQSTNLFHASKYEWVGNPGHLSCVFLIVAPQAPNILKNCSLKPQKTQFWHGLGQKCSK